MTQPTQRVQDAAKALAKRGLGMAGSAAAGALLGSVVPGLGTVVGAAVGALSGVTIGIGVDLGLLALEEKLTRSSMKAELQAAVRESLGPMRQTFDCPSDS